MNVASLAFMVRVLQRVRQYGSRARSVREEVITLDSDTRLPRDAAKALIGIAMHPLNQPRIDLRSRLVTEGDGVIQPRVSVTMASSAGSVFARVYAGHTGVDPYTTAVSDAYQDLFGEGIFTGKGLFHVDAFHATLDGRVPEKRAAVSRPLRGAVRARGARNVSRWTILDNLRRSLVPPGLVVSLVAGWTVFPGSPAQATLSLRGVR